MEKVIYVDGVETDYTATEDGVIYSNKYGRHQKVKYNTITGGYKMCYLYVKGRRHDILVHRVIARAFVPNPLCKKQINHKDGDKSNNHRRNLEWVTQSENIQHAYDKKLMVKTHKKCWNASLNEDQVKNIRHLLNKKVKQREIANMFGVNENIISGIKHGRSYKGVGLTDNGLAIEKE